MTFVGGVAGEKPRQLWTTTLAQDMVDSLRSLVEACGLDTLKRVYDNKDIMDGMVIGFMLSYEGRIKKTQVMNCWIPSLYNLASFINRLLPDKLRMSLEIPNAAKKSR